MRTIVTTTLICSVALVCSPSKAHAGRRMPTPTETRARDDAIRARLAAEGLNWRNSTLKGKRISAHVPGAVTPADFPDNTFPYNWSFDDGTLCGINQIGPGIQNMRAENGLLKFTTTKGDAYFAWGNFNPDEPPLRFGYGPLSRPMYYVVMRVRQSLEQSVWQIEHKGLYRGPRLTRSGDFTVKGKEWQTVVFKVPSGYLPYQALRVITKTPGNSVEIDWVKPRTRGAKSCFRKAFSLPAGVRWARCSVCSNRRFRLFVNGQEALVSRPNPRYREMWNFEIEPGLFRKGDNVVAFQRDLVWFGDFILDGALLCEDGTYFRLDSDETWKANRNITGPEWTTTDYDDTGWVPAFDVVKNQKITPPQKDLRRYWFNPSDKGQIMVAPVDGRRQPVFGSGEDIELRIAVPRRTGERQEVTYKLFDEMGDYCHAKDVLVTEGKLELEPEGLDNVAILRFARGELKPNAAYAAELAFRANRKEVERLRYEIAVCGPIDLPVVNNPTSYTDGMDLKLVWEVDAAAEQKKGEFISCIVQRGHEGNVSFIRESTVVETPLGRFRQTNSDIVGTRAWMSWKYRIQHPGRPHVAIAEYPEDTTRIQELRITENSVTGIVERANDCAELGINNPLTHKVQQHHVLFFPGSKTGALTIFSIGGEGEWQTTWAARVGKIRILEILNDVPARKVVDAPGPTKWFGQRPERGPSLVMQSCLSSPIGSWVKDHPMTNTPNFYRHWMITCINLVKRLRFAGENALFIGQYMYGGVLFPCKYSDCTALVYNAGSFRDYGVLMAKMFEENGLGLFSALEMAALGAVDLSCGNEHLAEGHPTLAQVDNQGRQYRFLGRSKCYPNWIHPEVRPHFETVINSLLDLYGDQKGWKGIEIQINEALGPCWMTLDGDPYFASYDDHTIGLFGKETHVRIPVAANDPKRFSKRYQWLIANPKPKQKWTDWRCRKLTEVYEWVRDRVKSTRPDLKFVLYTQAHSYMDPKPSDKEKFASVLDYARRGGLDLERIKKDKGIVLAKSVSAILAGDKVRRRMARSESLISPFANDAHSAIGMRIGWLEAQVIAPEGWVVPETRPESWPLPGGEYWADYYVNIFVRSNPTMILHPLMDLVMWNGREVSVSRFAKAFRSLPVGHYTRLTGLGRDLNVWIQTAQCGKDVYGYVANPQWWEVSAGVQFAPGAAAQDLFEGNPVAGRTWELEMPPYTIFPFVVKGHRTGRDSRSTRTVVSCRAEVAEYGRDHVNSMLEQVERTVEEKREVLEISGTREMLQGLLDRSRRAVERGDYSYAYNELDASLAAEEVERRNWKEEGYTPKETVARKRTKAIKIDGDLSEWTEPPCAVINTKRQVFSLSKDSEVWWTGEQDCSGTAKVQWDDRDVYLAFEVRDNSHVYGLFSKDSVEVFFDTDVLKDYGDKSFNEDDMQLKIAPAETRRDKMSVMLQQGQANGRKKAMPPEGIESAYSIDGKIYRLELRVPWEKIRPRSTELGTQFGFDVMLIDHDVEQGLKQTMFWSAPRPVVWKDVRIMGRLFLGDENGKVEGR